MDYVDKTKVIIVGTYTDDYSSLQKTIYSYETIGFKLIDIKPCHSEASNRTYVEFLVIFQKV